MVGEMIPVWLTIAVAMTGAWNIADGLVSIIYYLKQSSQEHLFRVIRISFGILLLVCLYLASDYFS